MNYRDRDRAERLKAEILGDLPKIPQADALKARLDQLRAQRAEATEDLRWDRADV